VSVLDVRRASLRGLLGPTIGHARGEEELHDEAAGAEDAEEAPFGQVPGEAELDVGQKDETRERDDGAPDREVVDRDEGVAAGSDGSDGCYCTYSS